MPEITVFTIVRDHPRRAEKPLALCVVVQDGDTRLDHEDYPVTVKELQMLKKEIEGALDA